MAKERPILFSTKMVQAILEGRKTQTRRIVKPQIETRPYDKVYYNGREITLNSLLNYCPYGQPGDLLWVRETFHQDKNNEFNDESSTHDTYTYKADHLHRDVKNKGVNYDAIELCTEGWYDPDYPETTIWRPSIHMPKEAARIWLKVNNVRVERLQAISDEDARAEGIPNPAYTLTAVDHFRGVWSSINGLDSWVQNPWVWVVEFEVLSKTGRPDFEARKAAAHDFDNFKARMEANHE